MDLEAANDDHAWQAVGVLARMMASGVQPGDLLGDSAYSHRRGLTRAVTDMGFRPVFDLHPQDSGPKGTYEGAVISNGCFYCPATPAPLLQVRKPRHGADAAEVARHDSAIVEREAFRLVPHSSRDRDGYIRLSCPAAAGKVRCPIKGTMNLPFTRPEVLDPPIDAPKCCVQRTIIVPPSVAEKTRQKHVFGSPSWRESFKRRTGVERVYSGAKDKACEDVSVGRIRVMGRTKQRLFRTAAYVAQNLRLVDAFERRAAPPKRVSKSRRAESISADAA